jgi:threonine dehydrogenase-like Zn-dependent dehydrogenase
MKVAELEKPGSLRVRSKPLRALEADEVLIKVESCGLCGTDLHIVEGTSRSTPPVVLGHEYAGFVTDPGRNPKGIPEGTHVAVDPNIPCGRCPYCRRGLVHFCTGLRALGVDIDGGMAEYSIVPASQLYTIPRGMTAEESMFIEPVSCAVHGMDRAGIRTGDTVVILGGGTIGLVMLQIVRHGGASAVIVSEPVAHKRKIAADLGASLVIDPAGDTLQQAVMDTSGIGADVVIDCAGTPGTARTAIGLARRGGTVVFFGVCPIGETIPLEPNAVYFRELTIVGSYINPYTFPRAIVLLRGGIVRVAPLEVRAYPLEGVHDALASLRDGRALKNMIVPGS